MDIISDENLTNPGQTFDETVSEPVTTVGQPAVYSAVRAVGIVKPVYEQPTKSFSNTLEVVGTAFWLKEYSVLITCAHVIENLLSGPLEQTGLLVVGNLGKYSRAQIAAIDLAHDLAILRMVEEPEEQVAAEAKFGLEITDNYPQVGTSLAYAGFPMGSQLLSSTHSPTYAEGVVGVQRRENSFRKEIQVTGAVAGGYSGAPVVLKDNPDKLVGVVANGPSPADSQGNIFMAISWEHVRALAELACS